MPTWTPHPYQLKAVQHLLDNSAAGLFLQPGLGKTSITMAALLMLRMYKRMRAALVIAPLTVAYNTWPAEARKWDEFKDLSIGILHGPRKGEVLDQGHDLYVINPEGLDWLFNEALKGVKGWPFDVLVVDESTKFKDGRTKRFEYLKGALAKFDRRYILTGTPAPNGLMDLWAQQYILDGGAALGRFVTHYRRNYFEEITYRTHSDWVPMPDSQERIVARLQGTALFMASKDYLDLPELTIVTKPLALPAGVMKTYRKLERGYVAKIGDGAVTAAHAAAAAMKLRQITGGHVYGEGETYTLDRTKLDALMGLLEERTGQPTMVIVNFDHECKDIQAEIKKTFGVDAPYLGGGLTPARRVQLQDQWNSGTLPFLLVHPTTGSLGLNLQAGGDTMIWYTLTWSLIEWDQMIRRLWRQGQEKRVFIIVLAAQDTIDERVADVLAAKDLRQNNLNEALKG